jgi:hypothetical protein
MLRKSSWTILAGAALALAARPASALTRQIAEVPVLRLTFGESVLNQLTYGTYRTPFDELQTRPENLLFTNIGRHPNLSPWPGQEGGYARYVDALVGNNGAANVDNDADAIQGSMVRRETGRIAWGLSAAVLSGTLESTDANATATFTDTDDLTGFDLRGGASILLSDTRVLGAGLRLTSAESELSSRSFEPGVGGFEGLERFEQFGVVADAGLRQFVGELSSWDVRGALAFGSSEQRESGDSLDDTGALTDRFVARDNELSDVALEVSGGYNRLRKDTLGETEYRGGILYGRRELSNSDLSYLESGGAVTPVLTLLGQDPVTRTELFASVRSIFQAGETEMFLGGRIGYAIVDGSTSADASGVPVTESIDDSEERLALVLGLRQPVYRDRLRIVVSGRGDLVRGETTTDFGQASESDTSTLSAAQYAVGLEVALSNVTLDLAWLAGEEAAVIPEPIGIPSGSRRTVELDRLVFSAAVSW